MNADRSNRYLRIVAHRVDCSHNLMQLRRVVVIVGVQLRAVDGEVEVGLALQ